MVDHRELKREVAVLRSKLRRYQVYLASALAVIGLSLLASVAVLVFYGRGLERQVVGLRDELTGFAEDSTTRSKALTLDLTRQQAELAALEKAARDDLLAIQEAHRKLASIGDPDTELSRLHEANAALWSALADQRQDLLSAFDRKAAPPVPRASPQAPPVPRFRLGETDFMDPVRASGEEALDGFVVGEQKVHRGSQAPTQPGHLVIELDPESIGLGDSYELAVRLVNRSNRALSAGSLRLDWSFGDRKTGGPVPLDVSRVDANGSAVLFQLSGRWTPSHETGPVELKATLTLDDGGSLTNTLSW